MPRWIVGALAAATLGVGAFALCALGPQAVPDAATLADADLASLTMRHVSGGATTGDDPLGPAAMAPVALMRAASDPALSRVVQLLRGRRRAPVADTGSRARQQILVRRGWIESLTAFDALPGRDDGAKAIGEATALLEASDDPVVDQNLVFHVAISFPLEISGPWLSEIRSSKDPAAREDALVALAFAGDPGALAEFERLAQTPSAAPVHRLIDHWEDFEAYARSGGPEVREVLRSYRAVETLDRVPYFKYTVYAARMCWPVAPSLDEETRRRLLVAWLARWPGHPGSDDMALRVGDLHAAKGAWLDAAGWYSRAATLPDQDVAGSALERLVGTAELMLAPAEIGRLLDDRELGGLNRDLLSYVRLRRLAAEEGLEVALAEAERVASGDPRSRIAQAWERWETQAPPKGLDSGLEPLAPDDPLRRVLPSVPLPEEDARVATRYPARLVDGYAVGQGGDGRLDPLPDALLLDVERTAVQLRTWRTLAELERRASRSRGAAKDDLRYKAAAVWFHSRDALYPAYGLHGENFAYGLRTVRWHGPDGPDYEAAHARYERSTYSWLRALEAFQGIERDSPAYAAMDRVLFSEALCWKRLADYRPYAGVGWSEESEARLLDAMRRTVEALDRCVRTFPDGPLADDCLRALDWWRRARPQAFE